MMKRQLSSKEREESVASKWMDLMQYEKQMEGRVSVEKNVQEKETNTASEKFQKIKENTSKKFSFIKSQVSGFCRKSLGQNDVKGKEYLPQEVNSSPNGESHTPSAGYGALRSLEAVGSRIKSSRSLQSLETATVDNLRTVVERTGGLGTNMRLRYGSHVDVAMGKYEQLGNVKDEDGVSEELRWR
eukprot:GFUD01012243.1.p1 GENE.GFUD01012243.1~~GFUD01012243.1.p1  ORF type:complete len:186 (+),score=63.33 GFUD01012243.1:131-688(+)